MRKFFDITLSSVTVCLIMIAVIMVFSYSPNRVKGQGLFLGPNVYSITAGASATMAAVPANPSRRAFTICNGHATQTATFTVGTALTPVSLTTGLVLATGNVVASCYTTPSSITSGVGAQINVIASGASTPVTVLEFQ
jgi:hypothetical protein